MSNNSSNNVSGNWISYTFAPGILGGWTVVSSDSTTAKAEKKVNKDGCNCKKCKELYEYAEPNQSDGSFICYSCRKGW